MDSKYWDITAKQLQGKASAAEQEALRRWLAQDPAHREQYAAQQRLWELTAPAPATAVDTDAAWQKVKGSLQARAQQPEPTVIPMYRTLLRIAASAVLLIGLAWIIQLYLFPYYGMQVMRSGNEKTAVVLPDSSHVWLNRNSLLAYDPDFGGAERAVRLEGEAFFEVRRNPQRPFVIETEAANTQVLGTSFNLRAYPAEGTVELAVATGKVAFMATEGGAQVILTRGFGAELSKHDNSIYKYAAADGNAWAWRTGKLQFSGTPLREVLADLEQYYHIELELQRPELGNCRFTGALQSASLQEALQVLEASLQINVAKQNEQTYTVSGQGCR